MGGNKNGSISAAFRVPLVAHARLVLTLEQHQHQIVESSKLWFGVLQVQLSKELHACPASAARWPWCPLGSQGHSTDCRVLRRFSVFNKQLAHRLLLLKLQFTDATIQSWEHSDLIVDFFPEKSFAGRGQNCQSIHLLRTHRKPFESMVRHTSVSPIWSQFRIHEVQLASLADQAPPRNTRFSPCPGPRGFSAGLSW